MILIIVLYVVLVWLAFSKLKLVHRGWISGTVTVQSETLIVGILALRGRQRVPEQDRCTAILQSAERSQIPRFPPQIPFKSTEWLINI